MLYTGMRQNYTDGRSTDTEMWPDSCPSGFRGSVTSNFSAVSAVQTRLTILFTYACALHPRRQPQVLNKCKYNQCPLMGQTFSLTAKTSTEMTCIRVLQLLTPVSCQWRPWEARIMAQLISCHPSGKPEGSYHLPFQDDILVQELLLTAIHIHMTSAGIL